MPLRVNAMGYNTARGPALDSHLAMVTNNAASHKSPSSWVQHINSTPVSRLRHLTIMHSQHSVHSMSYRLSLLLLLLINTYKSLESEMDVGSAKQRYDR